MIKVEEYLTIDGESPFAQWFNGLEARVANKVNVYMTRVEQGNSSNLSLLRAPCKSS